MTGSKRKLLHNTKSQPAQVKNSPIQRGITGVKQPREKTLKSSTDYSALIQKARWSKPAGDYLCGKHLRIRRNLSIVVVTPPSSRISWWSHPLTPQKSQSRLSLLDDVCCFQRLFPQASVVALCFVFCYS